LRGIRSTPNYERSGQISALALGIVIVVAVAGTLFGAKAWNRLRR